MATTPSNPAGFNPDEFLQEQEKEQKVRSRATESENRSQQEEAPSASGFNPDAFLAAQPHPPAPQQSGEGVAEEDGEGFEFGKELREQVDAIKAGVQEALDPFSLAVDTQKAYEKDRDVGDILTQTVANIATPLAIGAGVAASTTVAAPVALGAAALYGIYAGMGREYLRSNKENIEFSPIRGAAYSAFEINPLIKAGGKLNKLLRGAGQAVGEGAAEYSIKKDAEGAAAVGGMTAAGLALTALLGKGAAKLAAKSNGATPSQKSIEGLGDIISDKNGKIIKEVEKEIAALPDGHFQKLDADDEFKVWVRDGNGTKLDEDFDAQWQQLSEEAKQDAREMFTWKKLAQQKASESVGEMERTIRKRGQTSRSVEEPFGFIGKWMRDGLFISRSIDRATGGNTNFVTALNNMSEARNVFENTTGAFHKRAERLSAEAQKLKISDEDMGRILAGKMEVPENAQEVVKGWRDVFADLKNEMHNYGFKINELEDYFPSRSLKQDGLATALRRKSEDVQPVMERIKATSLDEVTVERLVQSGMSEEAAIRAAKDASDLKRVTKRAQGIDDKSDEAVTMDTVDDAIETSLRPGQSRASSTISAMFEKRGELPEFIRNYNVIDVYQNYVRSNLKAAIMHKPLENIRAQTAILDGLGMKDSAGWMKQYMRHAKGEQTGAVALWNTNMNKARFWADKVFDNESATFGERTLAKGAKIGPELMARMASVPYPAYLGLNAKAHVRNMAQNFLTTAPELGGLYGQQVVARGMARAAKDKSVGKENMTEFLREQGLLGDFRRLESLDRAVLPKGMGKHIETVNDALMWSYGQTETINRYWAVKAADVLVDDVIAGKPAAIKALKNMDVGTMGGLDLSKGRSSQNIQELIEGGNKEEVQKRVRDWMVSKALFNYGPEQNAQFSRHFGPLFSMFTKWPIMISSDIHEIFTKDKAIPAAMKFSTKYLAPLFALQAMDAALEDVKKEPMMKYTLGDFSKMSPIHSIEGLKDLGRGPVVKSIISVPVQAVKVLGAKDKGKAIKSAAGDAVEGVLSTYVPPVSTIMNEIGRAEKAGILSKDMRDFSPRGVRENLGLKKER